MSDEPFAPEPASPSRARYLIGGAAFLGGVAVTAAAVQLGGIRTPAPAAPPPAIASPGQPGSASTLPANTDVATLNAREQALAGRLDQLELRLRDIDGSARNASGYASRAEQLLLATAVRRAIERKTPLGSMKTLRHRAAVQAAVGESEARLRAARLLFYDTLATTWRRVVAGTALTLEQKADLMLACAHAVRTAAQVADLMHRMGGTGGIYARNRLERHFRDAQTVRHHGFLCESRLETVGQVYLGVEPELAMLAF